MSRVCVTFITNAVAAVAIAFRTPLMVSDFRSRNRYRSQTYRCTFVPTYTCTVQIKRIRVEPLNIRICICILKILYKIYIINIILYILKILPLIRVLPVVKVCTIYYCDIVRASSITVTRQRNTYFLRWEGEVGDGLNDERLIWVYG